MGNPGLTEMLKHSGPWRHALTAAVIVVACFMLYQSNGDVYLYSYDSAPNSLWTFNAMENHRLDFDNFRGGTFEHFGASYVFSPGRDGKLYSIFPIGTAMLAAPLDVVFDEQWHRKGPFDITSVAFERVRLHFEKLAANILAALAAMLLFFCAWRIGGFYRAIVVTAFFAAGSEMWTVGSQALWQHGPVNLVILAMTGALLAAIDARGRPRMIPWLAVAGICAGFLFAVRPTALVFTIVALGFAVYEFRRSAIAFGIGAVVGALPALVWNIAIFGTPIGGYAANAGNYVFTLPQFVNALAGLLVSPSRGLFVFTPLFVFSLVGLWRVIRARSAEARLLLALSVAAGMTLFNYAFYVQWWGGTSFGDRFLVDTAAVGALLLVFALPADPVAFVRSGPRNAALATAFGVLFVASVAIQFAGANGDATARWSSLPVDVDRQPSRVWALSDSQIERDARASLQQYASR